MQPGKRRMQPEKSTEIEQPAFMTRFGQEQVAAQRHKPGIAIGGNGGHTIQRAAQKNHNQTRVLRAG